MSRIGKKAIPIPNGVAVEISEKSVTVKGPKGSLVQVLRPEIVAEVKDGFLVLAVQENSRSSRAFWGLARARIANMVHGVVGGIEVKLQFEGVGYRANVDGDSLVLQLGFSHPVRFKAPAGISFSVEKNKITVSGIDKDLVGKTAAEIRLLKPPEPYKGKGIRYIDEVVRRKAGKKAVAAG